MIGTLIGAWLDVRSKPLRTFAAIAGMVAAVMAVVIVDAAAILSHNANDEYIAHTYGRSATLQIGPADSATSLSAADQIQAAQRLMTTLTGNGVTRVSPNVEIGMALVHGQTAVPLYPRWVASTFPTVSFVDLAAGQFPTMTAKSDALHLVITLDVARQLGFAGIDAVGQSVSYAPAEGLVPDLRTTIVHPMVIDAVARSMGTSSDPIRALIVSDLDQSAILGRGQRTWLVHVNPSDSGLVTGLVQSVHVGNSDQPAFQTRRIDQGQNLTPVLNQQRVTARAVTWVALVVGGLGILGVGLATVRERGKDFGLRRALGASKARVFVGVIVQTLIEVLLAAIIAIPLSAIVIDLFTRRLVLASLPLPASTDLPVSSAVRGLIAAIAVGLLAGVLPAARAARTSVVQALRD